MKFSKMKNFFSDKYNPEFSENLFIHLKSSSWLLLRIGLYVRDFVTKKFG